jgi:hypothetical protein
MVFSHGYRSWVEPETDSSIGAPRHRSITARTVWKKSIWFTFLNVSSVEHFLQVFSQLNLAKHFEVIFINVVAKGGTVKWNWHTTPDLCLATSWLHDLIYHHNIYDLQDHDLWSVVNRCYVISRQTGACASKGLVNSETRQWYHPLDVHAPICQEIM